MTTRFVSAAFRSANMGSSRREKLRQRSMQWAAKLEARRVRWAEQREARFKRYREALRGAWLTRVGLGLAAIVSFILNPPFVITRRTAPVAPFMMMGLPFMFKKNDKRRSKSKRASTTRNRLNPETLEQRMLLAAEFGLEAHDHDHDSDDGLHAVYYNGPEGASQVYSPAVDTQNEAALDGIFSQSPAFDGPGNQSIDVRYLSTITVFVDPAIASEVNTEAEFNTLTATATDAYPVISMWFVDLLSTCSTTENAPGIAGCAGGTVNVVESPLAAASIGPELQAHELGHNLGLGHTPANSGNLMDPTLNSNTTLTAAQAATMLADGKVQSDANGMFIQVRPIIVAPNVAPAATVSLSNQVTTVAENTTNLKVADIAATNATSTTLSGADAGMFEIRNGNELFIRNTADLDFESQSSYSVNVDVDGADAGSAADDSATLTLSVTDVSEDMVVAAADFPGNGHVTVLKSPGTGPGGQDQVRIVNDSNVDVVPAHVLSKINQIQINGGSGSQTVTVDITGGLGKLVFFDGGNGGAGENDELEIVGNSTAQQTITHTGPQSGDVKFGFGAGAGGETIVFAGLEPVLINAGTPSDVIFNLPGTADDVALSVAAGMLLLDSLNGTFEDTTFAAPASGGSVTVNLGGGNDDIEIQDTSPVWNTSSDFIYVNGGAGTDDYVLSGGFLDGIDENVAGISILPSGESLSGHGDFWGDLNQLSGASVLASAGLTLTFMGDFESAPGSDLTVSGTSAITFDGSNDPVLGGNTNIEGASSIDLTNANTFVLVDGSLLAGAGTVSGNVDLGEGSIQGNLTIAGSIDGASDPDSGTVSPGNSPGTITTGDLILGASDTLAIEIDGSAGAGVAGGHDEVIVNSVGGSGVVSIAGATLSLSSVGGLLDDGVYKIVDNDGVDPVVGTFAGLGEGASIVLGGKTLRITYMGGDGNDVLLFTQGMVDIEFKDGNAADPLDGSSSQPESGVGGTVPTLLVKGDLSGIPEVYRTVNFSLTPGSATEGVADDFTLEGTFTFPGNDFSSGQEFDLTVVDSKGRVSGDAGFTDPVIEINQDTFIEGPEDFSFDFDGIGLALSNATEDLDGDGSVRNGITHNIIDDDYIRITIAPDMITEGATLAGNVLVETLANGAVPLLNPATTPFDNLATIAPGSEIEFTVSDTNPAFTPGTTLAPGTATEPADYSFNDVTFTLDENSVFTPSGLTFPFMLTSVDDSLVEGDEVVPLDVTGVTSSSVSSNSDPINDQVITVGNEILIKDNDLATWSIEGASDVTEGADATYTIKLLGSGSGAGPFILQNMETASIDLAQTDGPVDPTTAADYDSFLAAVGVVAGTRTDLTLVGSTLTYTGDGTTPMADIVVDLTAIDDTLVEGPENYVVSLANPASSTGADIQLGDASVSTKITDNDLATWSITGSTNVNEGAVAAYTIALTGSGSGAGPFVLQAGETATIDIAQTDGPADATTSADYEDFLTKLATVVGTRSDLTLVGNTLTYTGDGSTAMTDILVNVTAVEDPLVEGPEKFTVTLSNPDTTTGADIQLGAAGSVETTIADNDLATWSVTGSATVTEGADATYTIKLTGSGTGTAPFILQAGETASIVVSQTDGPADPTTAADYDNFLTELGSVAVGRSDLDLTGNVLTYTGNGLAAMTDIVVNVTAIEDPLVEGPENFTVSLATPGTTTNADIQLGAAASVQTQITDNDLATWSIGGSANVAEGADATYTISLAGSGVGTAPFILQAGETASIVVTQTDGPADPTTSADYDNFLTELGVIVGSRADLALVGNVLTYTGDGTAAMADIVVNVTATEDSLVEGPENFTVTLSSPNSTTNADIQLGAASVQTAIADNDLATWSITGAVSVVEGANAAYQIKLTGSGVGAGPFILQAGETASIVVTQTDGPADPTTAADYASFLTALTAIVTARSDLTLAGNVLTYTGDGLSAMADIDVNIMATDDFLVEGPENYTVTLATPGTTTNADIQLGAATVQTQIIDNDFATWSISSNAPTVTEGNDVTYTIKLQGGTTGAGPGPIILQALETATIDLAQVDGPAPTDTNSSDYDSFLAAVGAVAAVRGDLDLTGNKLTYTGDGSMAMGDIVVMLTAIDDTLVEGSEHFKLVIDNPDSTTNADIRVDEDAVASGQDSVQTEIVDNDSMNWTLVETTSGLIDEGDAATYVLTLDGAASGMPGPASLQAGDTATIQIGMALLAPISLNDFDEESDQSLNELNPLGMAVQDAVDAYNTAAGTTTGADNSFGFSAGKVTYYGDSTTTAPTLTIVLNTFEDDGFEQGAGALKHLSNYVEPDESFEIMISNPGGSVGGPPQVTANGPNTVQTTIVDDNTTEITIMQVSDAQEGNDGALTNEAIINGLFEVKLSNPSQNIISVTLTDGVGNPLNDNGTASNAGVGLGNLDYQNSSLNVVNFSAGDQSEVASVDVIDDMVIEGTENVVATLTGFTVAPHIPSGATLNSGDVTIGATDSASLDIIDDDAAVLTVGDVTVDEDAGTATITVTLDKAVQNGFTVPYTFGMVGDTATGGSGLPDDYNNASGMLTFNGTIGEVVNITIPIFNDDVVEGNESFTVNLGTIVPGTNNSVMPPVATVNPSQVDVSDTGTVTINDDDIDLTLADAADQFEGNVASDDTTYVFTVTRTGLDTGTTTADWVVTAAVGSLVTADDFEGGVFPSGTVTFPNGVNTFDIEVKLSEDTTVEPDESFVVTLSNAVHVADAGEVEEDALNPIELIGNGQSATIINDDSANLTVEDVTVDEDAGTATLTVTLNGDVQGGLTAVYMTADGTAIAPDDYTATTSPVLTFAGVNGDTATFTVPIINDDIVESPMETFDVNTVSVAANDATIAASAITAADGATVTILDDDIDLTLSAITPVTQVEGNPGDVTQYSFTVTRAGLTTGTTTVDYTISGLAGIMLSATGATDFDSALTDTISFGPTETTKTIVIDVMEDLAVEADEQFEVGLSNAAHAEDPGQVPVDLANGIQILGNNQTAVIENDDMAILTTSDVTVYEDSVNHTITVTVTLDVDVQGGFSVDWSTEDITALVANNDYVPATGTLTFAGIAGESQSLTVTIIGDDVVEPDEQLRIVLSNLIPTDPNVDPADIKINGTGIPLNSQLTLTIDGSTFNETPPPMPTGGPMDVISTTNDPNQLVAGLLGSGITVVPGTSSYVGGTNSSGFFTGGGSSIQIESGIVLTTGSDAVESEPGTFGSGQSSGIADADLDAEFGLTTNTTEDVTYLEFDFISQGGDLFFDFVFASDEYSNFVFSSFNDVFAFFLDGQNIALIPGTTTPVSIDTVNNGPNNTGVGAVNPQFFNDNEDPGSPFLTEFGFDGFTDVFTAQALNLTPGAHTIKLAIADVGDSAVSSAVFFRANSFSGTPSDAFTATNTSSNPAAKIDQIQIDLSTASLEFDTGGASAGQAFTPTVGSDVDTGLTPVTLADGSSLLTMDFSDFMPGESLTWQVDVDSLGLDDVVTGDQVVGATVTVSFSDGTTATGILTAVAGNADAAQVILTTTPPTGPMGLITILNDDIDLDLKPTAQSPQLEGNSGTTTYTFEVTRAGFITGSTEDTTVDWAVTGSGNLTGDDFVGGVLPSGTVTFGPGDVTKTITVEVAGDLTAELDETFTVTLSNAQNADANLDTLDIVTASQSAVIVNDDTANVSVVDDNGAAPGDVTVQEPDTGDPNVLATFTIALDKPADEVITINITTSDGTATTANNDYVTTTQTVTIAAGALSTTFSVPVVGDNAVELDENFFITLSEPTYNGDAGSVDPLTGGPGSNLAPPVPQVAIVDATGEGIINNEDALIEFLQGSSIKNEAGVVPVVGENGPTLIVRGDLTGTSVADRTITLQRLGGTADPGNDFLFGSDPAQLLPATFVVPEGDYSAGNPLGMFDLTLWDEDGVLVSTSGNDPVLDVKDDSIIEGNESLTVELQGLGVALQQGNADQGLGLSGSTTIHDDTTHIIGDDDIATFTIVPGQSVDEEGGTQSVTVEMTTTGTTATPATFAPGITITLNTVDNLGGTATTPADYAFTPQALTFTSADISGATRTVDLTPASDLLVEGPETVDLGLELTSASPFVIGGQVVLVNNTVQINDDDSALIGLTVASTTVDEAAGTVTLNVQVDQAVPGGFSVDYLLTDGSATNGAADDYGTGATTGTIAFTGTAGEIVPIVVAINEDLIVEGLEDFTLTLTSVTNNTAPASFSAINPVASSAVVSITDNDGVATVTAGNVTVNEGDGTATVTLTLDKAVQDGFTVGYTTTDGTAVSSDYTSTTGTATFAGNAGETVTFTVPIIDDSVVEASELLNVALGTVTPVSVPAASIATVDGSVTIDDNDGPATVSIISQTITETFDLVPGAKFVTIDVMLDKAVDGGFDVDLLLADVTTTPLADAVFLPSNTLSFVGSIGEIQQLTFAIVDDEIVEQDETIAMSLGNLAPTTVPITSIDITSLGTLTILDDDGPATVSANNITVNENDGTATVTLTLDLAVEDGFTVDYTTTDGTADSGDYTTTTGTATFAGTAGETVTFTVPITDDSVVEASELLNITLGTVTPVSVPVASITTVDGSVTIDDNDGLATVTADNVTVNEGDGTATVTLTLDKAVQDGFTVGYTTTDGTADSGDYTTTTGTATFTGTAGETVTFTVPITDDSVVEASELLNIALGTVTPVSVPAASITTVDGSVTIDDNDAALVSLTPVVTATTEGGPVDKAEYTLALSPGTTSSTPTTVDFNTSGTARRIAGSNAHQVVDYTIWADDGAGNFTQVTGNQLTIPAGVNSIAIELRVVDDVVVEVQETVDLQLTGSTGGAVAAGASGITLGSPLGGISTIDDNDSATLIIKSVDGVDDVASETGTGDPIDKATFRVRSVVPGSITPSNPLGTPAPIAFNVSVGYDISTDSAVNTLDYTAIAGSVFFAPGVTEVPIDILPFDDLESEGPETVTLKLDETSESTTLVGAPIHLVQVDPGNCDTDTITILDNDFGDIVVEVGNVTANEGDGTVFVDVILQTSIPVTSSAIPVTLNFASLGATPGVDFTVASPTVTFNPGDLAGTVLQVAIDIVDDADLESIEAFGITMTSTYVPGVGNPALDLTDVGAGVIIDNDAMQVTDVKVSSTNWVQDFKDLADGEALGSGSGVGYSIPTGTGTQVTPLPWAEINQLIVTFSKDIDPASVVPGTNVVLHGFDTTPAYNVTVSGNQLLIEITDPGALTPVLGKDNYRIEILDTVLSVGGAPLDGDFNNGSDALPSGGTVATGSPGNQLNFHFVVNPGDATQNGITDTADIASLFGQFFQGPAGNYSIFTDFTGNAFIDTSDLSVAFGNFFGSPPASFPLNQATDEVDVLEDSTVESMAIAMIDSIQNDDDDDSDVFDEALLHVLGDLI
ncbi:MAG: Calx-beta domain-containing protein [Rubripirellula sp.]